MKKKRDGMVKSNPELVNSNLELTNSGFEARRRPGWRGRSVAGGWLTQLRTAEWCEASDLHGVIGPMRPKHCQI
jgi:hypothetical protein